MTVSERRERESEGTHPQCHLASTHSNAWTPPPPVVPLPAFHERRSGPPLALGPGPVLIAASSPAATPAARLLADLLASEAGVEASAMTAGEDGVVSPAASVVVVVGPRAAPTLTARTTPSAAAEGYELSVDAAGAELRAETAAGAFYGVQTLKQLLAATDAPARGAVSLPPWAIVDAPSWRWRGLLLDTARRRASVEWVVSVLDVAASLKLNVLHLHLTDDQGWRLPVPGRPRLVEVGGAASTRGAYRRSDIEVLRAAASARHVAIVPGVDVPGHCGAALAAYPECACGGKQEEEEEGEEGDDYAGTPPPPPPPRAVPSTIGVHTDTVLCAGSEAATTLVDDVLDGVCAAFPDARWVHVGGDEVPKTAWEACSSCAARATALGLGAPGAAPPGVPPAGEPGGPRPSATAGDDLHSWFVARASSRLAASHRTALVWDDVEPGGLPTDAGVVAWRGGGAGARAGRPTVMAPAARCYLDYRQADTPDEPGAWWGGVLDLETAFRFDPGAGDWGPGGGGGGGGGGGARGGRGRAATPHHRRLPGHGVHPPDSADGTTMSIADDGGRAAAAGGATEDDASSAPPAAAAGGATEDDASSAPPAAAAPRHSHPDTRSPRPPRPPPPRLPSSSLASILGGQACLWTETVADDGGGSTCCSPACMRWRRRCGPPSPWVAPPPETTRASWTGWTAR